MPTNRKSGTFTCNVRKLACVWKLPLNKEVTNQTLWPGRRGAGDTLKGLRAHKTHNLSFHVGALWLIDPAARGN